MQYLNYIENLRKNNIYRELHFELHASFSLMGPPNPWCHCPIKLRNLVAEVQLHLSNLTFVHLCKLLMDKWNAVEKVKNITFKMYFHILYFISTSLFTRPWSLANAMCIRVE